MAEEEELVDYEEVRARIVSPCALSGSLDRELSAHNASAVSQEEAAPDGGADTAKAAEGGKTGNSYVGIHATGFKDFLLKPEILRAIVDCGFEHPSEGTQRQAREVTRLSS